MRVGYEIAVTNKEGKKGAPEPPVAKAQLLSRTFTRTQFMRDM